MVASHNDGSGGGDHDREPGRRRGWSRSRELTGIVAVIAILMLISVVLIVVFQGQSGASLASSAFPASPTATVHFPPLPASAIYNPGARAVYAAGLGKHVDLTHTSNGYTLTVHWVYADAVQAIVYYSITPPANSNDKVIDSSLSIAADAAEAKRVDQSGGGVGGGVPISADGRADFLVASQDFQPLAPLVSQPDTISLVLTFSDIHAGSGVGQPGWVADGTTMHVTVPFSPGHTITVNKQESMGRIQIKLDRVIVAPSGVLAMLSYPNMKSINVQQWKEVLARPSDGVNSQAQEQGIFNVPGTPSMRFPVPPPASLQGNWSLTLRPYDSSGNPSTDQSQWLTFTFPVDSAGTSPRAKTTSSIPAEIRQNPGALQLYKAGLGLSLNKSVKAGSVTITLQWIYADAQQVWAAYTFSGLQANAGLQPGGGGTSPLAGPLAAQRICSPGALTASLDNGPAKRLGGSAQGGPTDGNAQGCLASEDVYFAGKNLGAVVPVTVTIHGETSTAASGAFSLRAKVQMIPGRAAPVHQSMTLAGKTLTLDGVNVTPTGVRLFFAGDATKLEYFAASHFIINGQQAGITTIGGSSTRWSSTGDQVYGLSYDDPGWEKPWTIEVMPVTKVVPESRGTPTVDSSHPAIFRFTLPPASWDTSIVATPTP